MTLPAAVALAGVATPGAPARRRAFAVALGAYVLAALLGVTVDLLNEAGTLMLGTLVMWVVFVREAWRGQASRAGIG